MKKLPAILLLALPAICTYGQVAKVQNDPGYDYKWIHFGFMVGLNTMDFGFARPEETLADSGHYFADISRSKPGFQVSIVSDLRMGDRLSLRFLPGITFGAREFAFYDEDGLVSQQTVESNFLDFPLLLKYKSWRVNNYRPYLVGGVNLRYDMAARNDYEENGPWIRLHPMDVYLELGFGIDFFLQYFKFSPELKVSAGFRDVVVHDPPGGINSRYVNSIDRLNSYLVMLCFYFE